MGLVLFLVANYVFGWPTPIATPPSSNLPVSINTSSTEQTKTGNLIIGGVLRLGQFATAPSGTEGSEERRVGKDGRTGYTPSLWENMRRKEMDEI